MSYTYVLSLFIFVNILPRLCSPVGLESHSDDHSTKTNTTKISTNNLMQSIKSLFTHYEFMEMKQKTGHFCSVDDPNAIIKKCCSCDDTCLKYGICCIDKIFDILINATDEIPLDHGLHSKVDTESTKTDVGLLETGGNLSSRTDLGLTETDDSLQRQTDSSLLLTMSEVSRYSCSPLFEPQMLNQIRESKSLKYMMISKCNNTSIGSQSSRINRNSLIGIGGIKIDQDIRKCLSSDYQSMVESIPVVSTEDGGDVYRSASCARCNGLRDDQFEFLNVTMSWTGPKNAFEKDLNDRNCVFRFENKFNNLRCYYDHPRSECKDPKLTPLCNFFSSPITPGGFANYFCYKCSVVGDHVADHAESMISGAGRNLSVCYTDGGREGPNGPFGWSIILDFSGKINIQGGGYREWSNFQKCTKGQVYDVFIQNCSGKGHPQQRVHAMQRIDNFITIVGSSVSILCYLLLIATYSKFKVLQNVPGLNTLAMSVCSLLAFTAFLFRRYHCQALVVLAHYFLLTSLMWVAIICIDLAMAIHSSVTAIRSPTNKTKTFKRYLTIAFLVPVPFVATPVILSGTKQMDIGYKERCWIQHFGARLGSYIIPSGLVYLAAISSLIKTLVKIHRFRKETKNILDTNQTSVNLVKVALKMTLGLGIIDILGFIQIQDEELTETNMVLAIVFSVVMSLKGVFVCVLYLLNRRVFNLYKCLFKKSIGTKNNNSNSGRFSVEMKYIRNSSVSNS